MADLTISTPLDPDANLLLEQSLLRLPHELLRKNLKTAQRHIEGTNKTLTASVAALNAKQKPVDVLASLDATLLKAQTLKRKLEALQSEERALHRQQRARIEHLQVLHEIPSLADVKYDTWAHVRLDRLLVDYLLRQGFTESARELAREDGIDDLVDVGVFEECGRIERALKQGQTSDALAWCVENKGGLKKINSNLELELRLQQFIELARTGDMAKLMEAVVHARKHLASGTADAEFGLRAGGLLAHGADTFVEPYRTMYSPSRYTHLATLFLLTHHDLLSLPASPLLYTALSAGLSALKTPSCHSIHAASSTNSAVCPICSTELNELARNVPYAHHTKSYIEEDPVVLPNGRVYGRQRLRELGEKLGVRDGWVADPAGQGREWEWSAVRRCYIS